MIVHRDYRSSNDSTVKIFDDKIEFFNPGGLIDDLTIYDVLSGKYRSHLRNKQIANIFKEIGLIEKYGSGIKRVIELFEKDGLRKPEFEAVENGFLVTIYKKVTDKVTDNQALILKCIKENNKITTAELSDKIGISQRKIKENISKLKELNLLERIGSPKGGYWKLNS